MTSTRLRIGGQCSNLFGRAKSPINIGVNGPTVNLPCRTKKSAWHLHGSYANPLQFDECHPCCNRIGHSVSAEFACATSLTMAKIYSVDPVAGNISTPPSVGAFDEAARRTPARICLFCLTLRRRAHFGSAWAHAGRSRHRQRCCERRDPETPQARHRPASALAAKKCSANLIALSGCGSRSEIRSLRASISCKWIMNDKRRC